jgi:hypothetical protein
LSAEEFAQQKNALFKEIVIFEDTETEASEQDMERLILTGSYI